MKNRVRELREERGISQEKLAQILGVSRQSIISIENGRYNPSLILAYQIPKYFNKSIEYVFFWEE
ncbi:helix-turn-helix transcriptional regulator [Paenibacillus larvae]|uniref:Helix-turn-helix transcriptional regulator n=1 Tax=Paenibacillus larvae TaxID=1464 RepID=A0AAP5JS46_9BACL|nr:helix-turn-helix transcriptional regulator [Paenibacillus larvae]AQR79187.1 transcriptional regulator [Paenibacillus larvae subsp. larvae]MCY7475470.1 helix-turn-helix transcriptional regulator [Paenibacillus larvae]MCY7489926.1 helix-turn-helix transcriptional regulator [Paenibacillus larvae]MCY9562683.1 helix-turn-helix transcriptional regulator [Paenibacillus larvae]MCY9567086.1 helix-turn-helix transcriptional regulator [Paenibacillus larvae]